MSDTSISRPDNERHLQNVWRHLIYNNNADLLPKKNT